MIVVHNLTKIYQTPIRGKSFLGDLFFRQHKQIVALDKVSFEIGEDELVGFIGPNGAGKTTTLKILSGILYPTSGRVNVLGFTPFEKKPEFLKQISFVMGQRNQLIWDLPAYDTFILNKEVYGIPDMHFKKIIDELISLLNCGDLIGKPVKMLSTGERMKMELIAALIHKPKIIFFDEPTIGLDIFSQETVREFIKKFQQEYKATIILTSHYLEDVKRLARRLIIIDKGKIIYDGTLRKIIEKYSTEKKVTITLERPVEEMQLKLIDDNYFYSFPKVVYKIVKLDLPEKVRLITKVLPFYDLTIEDQPIETIIKNFFKNSSNTLY